MGASVITVAHVDAAKRAWRGYCQIRECRETWLKTVATRTYRSVIQGVVDRNPALAQGYVYLAWIDVDSEDPDLAEVMLNQALRAQPNHAEARELLAWLRQGDASGLRGKVRGWFGRQRSSRRPTPRAASGT